MNLKAKTIQGVGWSGISQVVAQGFQFAVNIILARLLFPEDFGIVGMALIFTAFIATINELGLGSAIVQRKNINEKHLSTAFWASIFIGLILCIATIIISPLVASFFEEELVRFIVIVLSVGFVFGSFGVVHRALLEKKIDFKKIAITEIISSVFFGIVSIALALFGFGVWSLVIGSLVKSFVSSMILWIVCPWKPQMIFNYKSFKELFGFGKNVMGSRIIQYFSSNIDYLLIAKFLNASSLGLYTLAYQMAIVLPLKISSIISRVMFPIFSTIQDDNIKMRIGYLKVIKYTSLITFPLFTGLIIIAPQFILIAMGEKWTQMILPLQILCISGMLKSIGIHVGFILLSKGRSDIHIKWVIFVAIVLPISVLIGIQYGIIGVALAITITSLLLFMIIQKIANKMIDLSFFDFFKALYPAVTCSIILVVTTLLFRILSTFIYLQGIVFLVSSVVVGIISYALAIYIMYNSIFKEVRVLIKQLKVK